MPVRLATTPGSNFAGRTGCLRMRAISSGAATILSSGAPTPSKSTVSKSRTVNFIVASGWTKPCP
eukprot:scaffold55403_cov100-Phaeocystis_antarctica.AAC.3